MIDEQLVGRIADVLLNARQTSNAWGRLKTRMFSFNHASALTPSIPTRPELSKRDEAIWLLLTGRNYKLFEYVGDPEAEE